MRYRVFALATLFAGFVAAATAAPQKPISLHPDNGHYLLWRGKPTILVTSGEHYGGVLNRDFDYAAYFDTLAKYGFNLTRTFSGAYCEPFGAFGIENNTLAPREGKLTCPWARSDKPGYANGGNTFDLTKWDDAYFARLRDFVAQAQKRGIVVEMVLFCPFYEDGMWALSPMNAANNVNGIGTMARTDVYTLKHPELLAVQDAMVKKIVTELKDFDNLYYEICNEPYFGGVTLDWQAHIAETITRTEAALGVKHLIAQNIANQNQKIERPDPNVSIFNFHYAKPPIAVTENYGLNKVIGDDETGFSGSEPTPYRLEAWDFMIAGGAIYSNLDYSFSVGHEDGSGKINAPGGGGPILQDQLRIMKDFLNGYDFVGMAPDDSVIKGGVPEKAAARALVRKDSRYAVYINGGAKVDLVVDLPAGRYLAEWLNTKTGRIDGRQQIEHAGGTATLPSPEYTDDIALRVLRQP